MPVEETVQLEKSMRAQLQIYTLYRWEKRNNVECGSRKNPFHIRNLCNNKLPEV